MKKSMSNARPHAFRIARWTTVVLALSAWLTTIPAVAQTPFTILHSFSTTEGIAPSAGVILDDDGYLYGTTAFGGEMGCPLHYGDNDFGCGTIFKVKTGGTGYTLLHLFLGTDGNDPNGGLILDANGYLYGTTYGGGNGSCFLYPGEGEYCGTVFKIKKDGTGFSLLHEFLGTDGANPSGGLVLDVDGSLYGTTSAGGQSQDCESVCGTVFKVKTDGSEFVLLHSFADFLTGDQPDAGLILDSNGNLYGTTALGGTQGSGTVFKIHTDGTAYTLLHSFSGPDGSVPYAPLTLDGKGNLYGTTYYDGTSAGCNLIGSYCGGTVFRVTTDGTEFALLHSFSNLSNDGDSPSAGLVFDGSGYLYGVTQDGGANSNPICGRGCGTVFKVKNDGTGFTLLHSFSLSSNDGWGASSGLILDTIGNLYGATFNGGANGDGTIFKLAISPRAGVSITALPGPVRPGTVTGRSQ